MNDNNDTTKTNNNNSTTILSNGRSVLIDLLDFVRFVVKERIAVLSPDNAFTLRQIFGEEKWGMLNKLNKIEAGYCMLHLVENGELPFRAVEGKHEYPKLYQLNSPQLGTRIP